MKQSELLNDTDIQLAALTAAVNELTTNQGLLSTQVQGISNATTASGQQNSGLRNLLRNGDYNYSLDAYDNSPPVGGDPSFRAKSWYRYKTTIATCDTTATSTNIVSGGNFTTQRFGAGANYAVIYGAGVSGATLVSATLVRVDDDNATIAVAATNTLTGAYLIFGETPAQTAALGLHAVGFSTYAANEGVAGSTIPIWDKTTGQCWFGQAPGKTVPSWSIDQPLTLNLATPGQYVYVPFILKLRRPTDCLAGITATSTTLTATAPIFTIDDTNCPITIRGAGVAGADLVTTITVYTSTTVVTIGAAASTTVVAANTTVGDDLRDVIFFAGIWADNKWAEASPLSLTATKAGAHAGGGTTRVYYVVAETDWGQFTDSAQVTVTNTLATLDANNYVVLEYGSVVGALGYSIYRQTGTTYRKIAFVPQTEYFDTNENAGSVEPGFPALDAATRARAYIEFDLSDLPDGSQPTSEAWRPFAASIAVPSTYDAGTTTLQSLRYGLVTPTNVGRQLLVDRMGLSTVFGAFVISTLDADALNPPDGQSTSDQGPTGGGDPPAPGTGGPTCLWEEMLVTRRRASGLVEYVKGRYLASGDRILGRNGGWRKVKKVIFDDADELWEFTTETGVRIVCTDTERLVGENPRGELAAIVAPGFSLQTWARAQESLNPVASKKKHLGGRTFHIELDNPKDVLDYHYYAGMEPELMACIHNAKIQT